MGKTWLGYSASHESLTTEGRNIQQEAGKAGDDPDRFLGPSKGPSSEHFTSFT